MIKRVVLLLSILLTAIPIGRQSYLSHNWDKRMVQQALNSTVIMLVSSETSEKLGAGVVIKSDGTLLTAAHVVADSDKAQIEMVTYNGNQYNVRILLIDEHRDLALIQPIESGQRFKFARIAKSDKLYIGQDVLVIGHPYGDFHTVTSGIICRFSYWWWRNCWTIETDAVVNPGNSGGPMFDTRGELIGIISAMKVDNYGRSLGIGIAISIYEIQKFIKKYDRIVNKPKQNKLHSLREFL